MELKTEKGIKYFNIGFFLYIFGFFGGFCGGFIVIMIALILFPLGLFFIVTGREEYGEAHSKSVMRGLIFIIAAIIISMSSGTICNIISGSTGNVLEAVISVFSIICYSLGLVFLIYEISDNTGKKILWTAAIVYVIIGVIIAILTIWLYSILDLRELGGWYPPQDYYQLIDSISAIMVISTVLRLIPVAIFFFAYRRTYKCIKIGKIKPVEST